MGSRSESWGIPPIVGRRPRRENLIRDATCAEQPMKNPFLIGTQIYLRPLERDDAPQLVPWFNDPEITRHLRRYLPVNLQAEEEFIAKIYQSEHDVGLGIVLRETDQLIGATGLHQTDVRNRHTCFGILIGAKEAWGKGHGTEATALMVQYAFETLN